MTQKNLDSKREEIEIKIYQSFVNSGKIIQNEAVENAKKALLQTLSPEQIQKFRDYLILCECRIAEEEYELIKHTLDFIGFFQDLI